MIGDREIRRRRHYAIGAGGSQARRRPTEIKLLEIRDRGTCISAIAIKIVSRDEVEKWLVERAGYVGEAGHDEILLGNLDGGSFRMEMDPYKWPGSSRTMRYAHLHINDRWEELKSGDVIDVQFLNGERLAPKISDRIVELRLGGA